MPIRAGKCQKIKLGFAEAKSWLLANSHCAIPWHTGVNMPANSARRPGCAYVMETQAQKVCDVLYISTPGNHLTAAFVLFWLAVSSLS